MTIRRSASMIVALLLGALLLAPSAGAAPPEDTCPVIVPEQSLDSLVGDSVEGWTVFEGTEPVSFPAEVISVQDNAWLPGDRIVWAKASGPEIEAIDGIAYGMSGSPVYTAGGELIGALAYGLSSNSRVFGITPAYQMETALPYQPVLSAESRSDIQRATGKRAAGPRVISPVLQTSARGPILDKLSKRFGGARIVSVPSSSSSRGATPVPGASMGAGDVMVASLAKGRTDFSGLGTATYVCENSVLGFGHPFFGDPNSRAILSQGEVYQTITEPAWGSYKYGVPTDTVGAMLRDNSYAIGGTIGQAAEAIEMSGRVGSFEGELTELVKMPINSNGLVADWGGYPYFSSVAGAAIANEIYAFDSEYSQFMSATGGWTISGTADGKPFSFVRSDAWSGYETDPVVTFWNDLDSMILYGTEFGSTNLDIDSISPNLSLQPGLRSYRIAGVHLKVGKGGWRKNAKSIRVRKGQSFFVRLSMRPNAGGTIQRVLRYRGTGRDGFFSISPKQPPAPDEFGVSSFQELLRGLGAVKNTRLAASVKGGRYVSGSLSFDRVVSGFYGFSIDGVKKKKKNKK